MNLAGAQPAVFVIDEDEMGRMSVRASSRALNLPVRTCTVRMPTSTRWATIARRERVVVLVRKRRIRPSPRSARTAFAAPAIVRPPRRTFTPLSTEDILW